MLEETEELLVAVPVLAEPGHLPGGDFQGGEQGGGAMADVVVAALLVVARLHHKHLLGAVQRLDLGLLIDAQHDRVGRRVQIQAYNVGDLGLQFRVGGELERVGLPWPDPLYFFQALVTVDLVHPQTGSQQPTRPVSHPQTLQGGGLGVAVMIAASSTTFDQPGRGMSTSPSRPCSR